MKQNAVPSIANTKSTASNKQRFLRETISFPGHPVGVRKVKSSLDLQNDSAELQIGRKRGNVLVTCCQCGSGPYLEELAPACTECGHRCGGCILDEVEMAAHISEVALIDLDNVKKMLDLASSFCVK